MSPVIPLRFSSVFPNRNFARTSRTAYDTRSGFVFRLIYLAARNVKEMLFEKFVQCDVGKKESFSPARPRLTRKNDSQFPHNGIMIRTKSGCIRVMELCAKIENRLYRPFYAQPRDFLRYRASVPLAFT